MSNILQTIKGTKDILPEDAPRWRRIEAIAAELFARYNYQEIRTPIFEATDLFARGIGEQTDIVGKEMYSFEDRGGRNITLRPENTAGVARAYIQHKLYTRPAPQKLWYMGPMFRAENVAAGRQRQFSQIGVECLGADDPRWDAESIVLAADFLERAGLAGIEIQLNSVGCAVCRPAFRDKLQGYLRGHVDQMCGDCKVRTEKNPLRTLDCKVPADAPVIAAAPPLDESLCDECRASLGEVTTLLDAAGVAWVRNPRLVRGLDYYNRTVFEIVATDRTKLGSQSTVCAGGRYNGLVGELGGPETPAVGWGLGIERLLTLMPDDAKAGTPLFGLVMGAPGASTVRAFQLARDLRRRGLAIDLAPAGKLDKQFKQAERLGACYAFILGESELAEGVVTIKDLAERRQERVGLNDADLDAWLAGRGKVEV